jgi:hypothetical protein
MGWAQRVGRVQWGRRQKVVVGYPVGGSVTLAFHASMLRLLGHEMPKGEQRLLAKVTHSQGLYVADNRDLLVQRLLESDADWLLQIDTDIEFPETLIEALIERAGEDRRILAASVPLGNAATCGYMRVPEKPGIWHALPQIIGDDPVEVDGVATAILLVHRRVYEDIADRHGQCWHHSIYIPCRADQDGPRREFKYISTQDDLAFSIRAREAGHRIWVCYVPGLKHHKGQALTHDRERLPASVEADLRVDHGVGELVREGAA